MKPPSKRTLDAESAYTNFTWKTPPTRYAELPQLTDLVLRSAKCFVVENDVWVNGYPETSHDGWWDETVGPEYPGRHYTDADPTQVLLLRLTHSGHIVVNDPILDEATDEAIARFARVLEFLQVPDDTLVQWNAGVVTHDAPARDYYDHLG